MNEAPKINNTKTRIIERKRTLADGTSKVYTSVHTYQVKGYINPDGKVTRFSEEQMEEMRRLRKLGVPKTRLAKDFGAAMNTITKIVGE